MTGSIRIPDISEKAAWLPLWGAYLSFYENDLSDEITNATWRRFHAPDESMHLLAVYENGRMAGFATYLLHGSTWSVQPYCYLEDLFVGPEYRAKGFARGLVGAVADAARAARCERLYWMTKESNKTAQALYDKLARKTDFIQYRMRLD